MATTEVSHITLAAFMAAYQDFLHGRGTKEDVQREWKRAVKKNSAQSLWGLAAAMAAREGGFQVEGEGLFREGKVLRVGQMAKRRVRVGRAETGGRSSCVHLPGGDPGRKPAGTPPPGCIGPPDPIPLHDNREMAFVVQDCAGVDLDKGAVERLVYMLRRAHGIGLAEGMRRGKPKSKKKPRANPVTDGIMRRALRGT